MFKAFKMLMLNFGGGGGERKGIVGLSTKTADELGSVPLQFKEKWDSLGRKKGFSCFCF